MCPRRFKIGILQLFRTISARYPWQRIVFDHPRQRQMQTLIVDAFEQLGQLHKKSASIAPKT